LEDVMKRTKRSAIASRRAGAVMPLATEDHVGGPPGDPPADDGEKSQGDRAQSMLWRALAIEALSNSPGGGRAIIGGSTDEGVDV
jgi:hypothetical protein